MMPFIICILILIAIFYTHNNKWRPVRPSFYPLNHMVKIGHRGAPTLARENTLESFTQAFQAGLKGIELDVQLSKDGEVVVFHDWGLENKNGSYENIIALNYSEILTISYEKNYHIPLLNEVLDILPKDRFINIEIKSLSVLSTSIEKKMMEIILSYNILENVVISSFNPFALRRIKKLIPTILSAYLWTGNTPPFLFNTPLWIWICKPDGFYIDISYVDEKLIRWLRRKNLTLLAYTVNNTRNFALAKKMGLDGIFTDDPYLKLSSTSI